MSPERPWDTKSKAKQEFQTKVGWWLLGACGLLLVVIVVVLSVGGSDADKNDTDLSPTDGHSETSTSPYGYEFDGQGANVEKAQFGDDWPLTLASGRVNCVKINDGAQLLILFTADDSTQYALNGTAKAYAEDWDAKDIEPIWAEDPDIAGAKKDIGVLIEICDPLQP